MAKAFIVSGVKELDRALAQFEPKFRRKIERKALRAAGRVVLDEAKAGASEISPRIAKLLTLRKMRSRKGSVGVRIETTKTAESGDGGVLNPHWFEFGAPGHLTYGKGVSPLPERPFVRPAMERSRGRVRAVFLEKLTALTAETAREVNKPGAVV